MIDISAEALLGLVQNKTTARAHPSAAEDVDTPAAFARVMDLVRGQKDDKPKEESGRPVQIPVEPIREGCASNRQFAFTPDLLTTSKEEQTERKGEKQAPGTSDIAVLSNCSPIEVPAPPPTIFGLSDKPSPKAAPYPSIETCAPARLLPECRLPTPIDEQRRTATEDCPGVSADSTDELAFASTQKRTTTAEAISPVLSEQEHETLATDTVAAELETPPIRIHVSELQTYLPSAIAVALSDRSNGPEAPQAGTQHQIASPPEQQTNPVKILRFEVEPETLGSISVRMRVTHTGVDIQIAADNASTSALLFDTRESLTAAIGEKGLNLHSYEVMLSQAPAPANAPGGQSETGFDERRQAYAGERGYAGDDRPGQRSRQGPQQEERRRDDPPARFQPIDLVL
jgi:hypothetical protein